MRIAVFDDLKACPATQGWQERIQQKLIYTACLGGAYGGLNALRHKQPLALYVFGTAASSCIIVGMFAVTLEGVRATTCRDHLSNSTISGALTGAATFALHFGRKDAISGAIAGSILGTVSHWLHASVKPGQTWARLREDLGLGTPPEGEGEAAAPSPSGKLRAVRPEDRWEEFAERWRGK